MHECWGRQALVLGTGWAWVWGRYTKTTKLYVFEEIFTTPPPFHAEVVRLSRGVSDLVGPMQSLSQATCTGAWGCWGDSEGMENTKRGVLQVGSAPLGLDWSQVSADTDHSMDGGGHGC